MATTKLRTHRIKIKPSPSGDIVKYFMLMVPAGTELTEASASKLDLGMPPLDPDSGYLTMDLDNVLPADIDGVFDIAVYAEDDGGNTGEAFYLSGVPFDRTAPAAPLDVIIERL